MGKNKRNERLAGFLTAGFPLATARVEEWERGIIG